MGPVSARRDVMAPEYRRIGGRGLSWERGLSYWLRRKTIRRWTHAFRRDKEMGFVKNHVRNMRERDPACTWRAGSASVVGTLATMVLACTPPDRPARVPEPLPEELLSYLGADSIRALFIHDGLSYHFVWSERGPWAVHVLRLDLERCDLGLRVLPAGEAGLYGAGLSTVTELVGGAGSGVLAAVNGDFFTPEGRPLGSEVAAGQILWSRERPALEWTPGRAPWIGTIVREGSGLSAGAWVSRSQPGRTQVIGGYPELLDAGAPLMNDNPASDQGFSSLRHPRTAVAYDPEARRLWVLVVDGRQGSYSSGMTLAEVTDALSATGAAEALNLDGGGSSVMITLGRTMSRPSDEEGERAVRNALAVVSDPAFCRAAP
jgi:hypothetical protein